MLVRDTVGMSQTPSVRSNGCGAVRRVPGDLAARAVRRGVRARGAGLRAGRARKAGAAPVRGARRGSGPWTSMAAARTALAPSRRCRMYRLPGAAPAASADARVGGRRPPPRPPSAGGGRHPYPPEPLDAHASAVRALLRAGPGRGRTPSRGRGVAHDDGHAHVRKARPDPANVRTGRPMAVHRWAGPPLPPAPVAGTRRARARGLEAGSPARCRRPAGGNGPASRAIPPPGPPRPGRRRRARATPPCAGRAVPAPGGRRPGTGDHGAHRGCAGRTRGCLACRLPSPLELPRNACEHDQDARLHR